MCLFDLILRASSFYAFCRQSEAAASVAAAGIVNRLRSFALASHGGHPGPDQTIFFESVCSITDPGLFNKTALKPKR